jgi:CheY-like chemotaxis protein
MLLVEDDADTREVLADLLSEHFDVVQARDGMQALELIHEQAPDVIVTDESLPRLTGTELAKTLRSEGITTPILLVSGYRSGLDTSCCNAVMPKPIEVDELIRQTERLLAAQQGGAHAGA